MRQYKMFELVYQAEPPQCSQVDVDLVATFEVAGTVTQVKGFYAGHNTYKVRFFPEQAGTYSYKVTGLVEAEGLLDCRTAEPNQHGLVRAEGLHFKYADGTRYYPFGTTVYALIHQSEELVDKTMASLEASPFNKIRMCLFPKDYSYNQNDPEFFAFEKNEGGWDYQKPCFEFWEHLENRLRELEQLGIQSDLILFHPYDRWGFAKMTQEEARQYLDYATRRLSAFPNIWWSLANEYDLMDFAPEDWEFFADYIGKNDPYHHLLSNHNIVKYWDFNNKDTSHICLQIADVDTVRVLTDRYKKPMMIDECRYEGNLPEPWGNISGFEMVSRFWKVMLQGGYCTHGETYYNEEEIIWWAKGGELVGDSPSRIAFLKSIVEELPGPLECWPKYGYFNSLEEIRNAPEEMIGSPIFKEMLKCSDEDIARFAASSAPLQARSGANVFIKYFERQRPFKGGLDLPEEGHFNVEVIDTWEMTRELALEKVNGAIEVPLPSKEGMAILAYRVQQAIK